MNLPGMDLNISEKIGSARINLTTKIIEEYTNNKI